jgi:hypothetical protein
VDYLDKLIQQGLAILGWQVMMILGMILFDWVLGVAVAIQAKKFDLKLLADFMLTMIVPKLFAWLGAAIFAKLVLPTYLPPELAILGPGLEYVLFTSVVASLGGSIVANLKAINGLKLLDLPQPEIGAEIPQQK